MHRSERGKQLLERTPSDLGVWLNLSWLSSSAWLRDEPESVLSGTFPTPFSSFKWVELFLRQKVRADRSSIELNIKLGMPNPITFLSCITSLTSSSPNHALLPWEGNALKVPIHSSSYRYFRFSWGVGLHRISLIANKVNWNRKTCRTGRYL